MVISIAETAWSDSLKGNLKSTQSKHFARKTSQRFFTTPDVTGRISHAAGSGWWRVCGEAEASHTHLFLTCPAIERSLFWVEIHILCLTAPKQVNKDMEAT